MTQFKRPIIPDGTRLFVNHYYVNTSGSDTNPGTQALPWQTINKVNSATFLPGDRIFFAGGQIFTGPLVFTSSSAGTATNPIVVWKREARAGNDK